MVAGNATATNASSSTTPSTINITNKSAVTSFQAARHQYLEAWNHTTFHSALDAFIQQGSDKVYGVYITHPPVFKPGDSIALYVEPVGYSFKQVIDERGNSLNQVNLTADITITSNNGTQLTPPLNATPLVVTSHNKNTELFMTLRVDQSSPFPVGDYKIKYNIKDGSTGKSFQLVKSIRVANTVTPG